MSTLRLVWEVIRYRPGRWFFCFVMWTFVHGLPLLFGILIGLVFERLSEGSPVDETAWAPAILFGVLAIGRNIIIWLGDRQWKIGRASCRETVYISVVGGSWK